MHRYLNMKVLFYILNFSMLLVWKVYKTDFTYMLSGADTPRSFKPLLNTC